MTYLVCEARGHKEDRELELELELRRIRDDANHFHKQLPFDLIIANKKQTQKACSSRTCTALEQKYGLDQGDQYCGTGLKVFP